MNLAVVATNILSLKSFLSLHVRDDNDSAVPNYLKDEAIKVLNKKSKSKKPPPPEKIIMIEELLNNIDDNFFNALKRTSFAQDWVTLSTINQYNVLTFSRSFLVHMMAKLTDEDVNQLDMDCSYNSFAEDFSHTEFCRENAQEIEIIKNKYMLEDSIDKAVNQNHPAKNLVKI